MGEASIVGALRVVLGIDTANYDEGLKKAQGQLVRSGRELKKAADAWSGAGVAMSAALTVPLGLFAVTAVRSAQEASDAIGQVDAALASMGGASGKSLESLQAQADGLMKSSLFDDDDILRSVTANLLTFGNVAGPVFDRAQQSIVDLATRLNVDLQSATLLVGKALNDPIKGLTALSKSGIQFTAAQKEQIKALVAGGEAAKAQAIILAELERQFAGAALAAQNADPFNALTDALNTLQETIGAKLLPAFTPIVQGLTGVAEAFGSLSPPMQNFILGSAAVAAAIGPVILVAGSLTSATGTLIATFGAGGAGATALAAAIATVASPMGLVAASATALVGALGYLIWRETEAARAAEANRFAHERLDPILDATENSMRAAAAAAGDVRRSYLNAADAAFLLGEEELKAARKAVIAAQARVAAAREVEGKMFDAGLGGMSGMGTGVEESGLKDAEARLRAIEDGLIDRGFATRRGSRGQGTRLELFKPSEVVEQAQAVTRLSSAVGELGQSSGRAGTEAKATRKEVEELAAAIESLNQRVMLPEDRQAAQLAKDYALLAEAYARGAITAEQLAASMRLLDQAQEAERLKRDTIETDLPTDLKPTPLADLKVWGGKVMSTEEFDELQRTFRDAVNGGFRAALDGDLEGFAKDWIAGWASRGLEEALNSLSDVLMDVFSGVFEGMNRASADGDFSLGQLFGSIFGGGSGAGDFGLPGFATGGSFTVGGSGGIDSQIRAMRLTPGERVSVSKGDAANDNRAPVVFDLRGAVMTDDLLRQMNDISLRHSAAVYGQVQTDKVKAARSAPYRKTR
ncbi:MAG: hypothetical protein KA105_09840 [Caulobacter sp.]|nr:hypothetical protein [Caulobacter sp.]